jgi:RNA polymerase sigma-70 factor (ECF subfamily)
MNNIRQDKKLFKRIKEKDKDAFLDAYDAYADDIYRFIFFKIGSVEEARDITSAVFLKVWEYAQSRGLDESKSLRAFIYKTARNSVIDHYRSFGGAKTENNSQEIMETLADDKQDSLSAAEKISDLENIKECLEKLKEEYREIILMRFIDELSFSEIAEITGRPIGNLRVLSFRALQALKELMEKNK